MATARTLPVGKTVGWTSLTLAAVMVLARGVRHDWLTGDTKALVAGLPAISRCLQHGHFTRCNYVPVNRGVGVSKFPLIQTVPAYALHELGIAATRVVSGLTTLNALAVLALFAAVGRWCHRRGGLPLAVVGLLLLGPGMLVPYTAQSFGEALSAAVFGAVVLAGLRSDRASAYLLPATALATVTKETAAVLVIVFAAAAILLSGAARPVLRSAAIRAGLGILLGLLADAAFNEFRYGTLVNHVYLDEGTARAASVPINTLGLLIAPNGGITWFWPGAAVAAVVLLIAAGRRSGGRQLRIGAACGLLGFAGTVLSAATWWDPYGWYCWGPRLLIPGATATVILAISVIARQDLRRTWLSWVGAALLGAVAVAVLLPSVGAVFDGGASQSAHILATWVSRPECHSAGRLPQRLNDSCTTTEAWRTSQMPLDHEVPRSVRGHGWYWLTMVSTGVAVVTWLALARRRATDPDRTLPTEPEPVVSAPGR